MKTWNIYLIAAMMVLFGVGVGHGLWVLYTKIDPNFEFTAAQREQVLASIDPAWTMDLLPYVIVAWVVGNVVLLFVRAVRSETRSVGRG